MSRSQAGPFVSVVIPAYNEQHRLGKTLDSVTAFLARQDYAWDVTVVDDGSSDETSAVVRDHGKGTGQVALLRYSPNRGKGYAVRHGMQHVTGSWRLFMDADNATSIEHLDAIRPILENDEFDIVIGSRRVTARRIVVHQPFWKEALGDLGGLWIRLLAVSRIQDTQAGFKIVRGTVAERILPLLTLDGWAFDVELLAVARHFGYSILEHPIRWSDDADTKVTPRSYLEALRDVLRVRRNLKRGTYGPNE